MRKEKWNEEYDENYVVMWYNMNVSFLYQSSLSNEQRLTHSSYYSENALGRKGEGGILAVVRLVGSRRALSWSNIRWLLSRKNWNT